MEDQAIVEDTLDTMSDTLDTIERTLETIEDTKEVFRNNPMLITGVAVVAVSVGVAVGYYVANKRLSTKYDHILAEQVEAAREFYSTLNKDRYPTPEALLDEKHPEAKAAAEAAIEYSGQGGKVLVGEEVTRDVMQREVEEEVVVESRNIFVDGKPIKDSDWDSDAEESSRTPGKPYIITQEEFFQNETDYEQMQLTYYEGDDILVDEASSDVVNKQDDLVGDSNLQRFGHGSKDKHIVYIRNDAKELEFEIARSRGKYSKEVLGMDEDDDEQETMSVRRRIRGGDE